MLKKYIYYSQQRNEIIEAFVQWKYLNLFEGRKTMAKYYYIGEL